MDTGGEERMGQIERVALTHIHTAMACETDGEWGAAAYLREPSLVLSEDPKGTGWQGKGMEESRKRGYIYI